MDIAGIQSGMVGMALFDAWDAIFQKRIDSLLANRTQGKGSPLLAAADQAFRSYISSVETQNGAQIQALSTYALTPSGNGASVITPQQMAPFLALNLMA
jgi:hypothetical protein